MHEFDLLTISRAQQSCFDSEALRNLLADIWAVAYGEGHRQQKIAPGRRPENPFSRQALHRVLNVLSMANVRPLGHASWSDRPPPFEESPEPA